MSLNQIESLFLSLALTELEKQLVEIEELNKKGMGRLDLGSGYLFMLTKQNKLTIAESKSKTAIPREDIVPVNYLNWYRPMCMADAVREYLDLPDEEKNSFFI